MKPIEALSNEEARRIDGLLFDLDDTLLSHGVLLRAAYDALWDLNDAGLGLIAVTGRGSTWGKLLAMQWPILAATTENGAIVAMRQDRRILLVDRCERTERAQRREKLADIQADVEDRAPDMRLTDDASGRISDITWDIGENERVAPDRVAFVRAIIAEHGARSSCSSVHLHATFDADDKATGTVRLLSTHFGIDATGVRTRWAFVGDSGNDRACFAAFNTTFGVANVRASMASLTIPPRYVTKAAMGDGFAEIARRLLRCKLEG